MRKTSAWPTASADRPAFHPLVLYPPAAEPAPGGPSTELPSGPAHQANVAGRPANPLPQQAP